MDATEKQLDFLNQTMKDTAAEANEFLRRYHFGGMVAVIALLNVDLISLRGLSLNTSFRWSVFVAVLLLAVALSYVYFGFIIKHYNRFTRSHRKLKYKYELTLHHALCGGGDVALYQYYLERGLGGDLPADAPDCLREKPDGGYEFRGVADYLLVHHAEKLKEIESGSASREYIKIAMLIICLTVIIKLGFLLVTSGG
jgi:hypothetical protein